MCTNVRRRRPIRSGVQFTVIEFDDTDVSAPAAGQPGRAGFSVSATCAEATDENTTDANIATAQSTSRPGDRIDRQKNCLRAGTKTLTTFSC